MPLQTKAELMSLIETHEKELRIVGVRKLGLSGSFARGEQKVDSDVDVLVEFDPGQKKFDNFMGLSFFLEDLFKRPVELVTAESLAPRIRPRILTTVEYARLSS